MGGSGSRRDFLVALFGTRTTCPATRARLDDFRAFAFVLRSSADCRRQGFERDALVRRASFFIITVATLILVAVVAAVAARPVLTLRALALRTAFLAARALGALVLALILAAFG